MYERLSDTGWVNANQGRKILGVTRLAFERIARTHAFTVKKLPEMAPRYLRADIERLARDSVTPAKA